MGYRFRKLSQDPTSSTDVTVDGVCLPHLVSFSSGMDSHRPRCKNEHSAREKAYSRKVVRVVGWSMMKSMQVLVNPAMASFSMCDQGLFL